MKRDPEAIRQAASELTHEQLVEIIVQLAQGCPCTYTGCACVIRELEEQGKGQTRTQLS